MPDTEVVALSEGLNDFADLQSLQADYTAAEQAYREAIGRIGPRPKDHRSRVTLANSLFGLGSVLRTEGRYPEAERSLREALAMQTKLYGAKHGDIGRTLVDLAMTLDDEDELKAALPLMRSAVNMQRELYGSRAAPGSARMRSTISAACSRRMATTTSPRRCTGRRLPCAAACTETSTRRSPRA